ncbi:TonB C-terminal domain-containing protein [Shewanella sp. SR44-3]|uniref:TonB C-terminal domain-containing protein n=1 Tax=Shewanella sp. SR44-3 TaxID=2760936 RepID=UPI0015F8DCAB|nr:TonB C-terminal domain-containing protein [Shewanella sp. SR44-3]MBB1270352.1 TonB C-terminal domain-containing protein [Shewanella sp. SR44-3]
MRYFSILIILFFFDCIASEYQVENSSSPQREVAKKTKSIANEKPTKMDLEVSEWVKNVYRTIQNFTYFEKESYGHSVTVNISIDSVGAISDTEITKSTGNATLEKTAMISIYKSAPFDLSQLSENSLERVKKFKITFLPIANKKGKGVHHSVSD